mmetsp:Transcript_15373/g.36665  ORF Transcript_15373/g.36665 Transcript_15373/m.36665 type:complete len:97 (-) Transcript_15373:379-669(-)
MQMHGSAQPGSNDSRQTDPGAKFNHFLVSDEIRMREEKFRQATTCLPHPPYSNVVMMWVYPNTNDVAVVLLRKLKRDISIGIRIGRISATHPTPCG